MRLVVVALVVVVLGGCGTDTTPDGERDPRRLAPDCTVALSRLSAQDECVLRPGTHRYPFRDGPAVSLDVPEDAGLKLRWIFLGAPRCEPRSAPQTCTDGSGFWLQEVESGSRICVGRTRMWMYGEPETLTYSADDCGRWVQGRNQAETEALFDEVAESIRLTP